MPTPCTPIASARLLAAAALLNFRATARDRAGSTLGVLVDASGARHHLVVESGGADGTWVLASALPAGTRPFLLYESTANVLRGGDMTADGAISYQGTIYTIESSLDGATPTAKVSGRA